MEKRIYTVIPKTDRSPYRSGTMSKFFNRYKRYILMCMGDNSPILPIEEYYSKLRQEESQHRIHIFEKYLAEKSEILSC